MDENASNAVTVKNTELATVREAMRELSHLLERLDAGEIEKIVLTQKNQMRAVLLTVQRYAELDARPVS
jgi:antitoxin (DNA-binding transcriptional repressor) of toxin-antitoxin stability system